MPEEKAPEQKFLETVIKELVTKPDKVCIERKVDELGVLYIVTADSTDVATIIGKKGSIAQAIRLLLKVSGYKHNVRASMKIDVPHNTQNTK